LWTRLKLRQALAVSPQQEAAIMMLVRHIMASMIQAYPPLYVHVPVRMPIPDSGQYVEDALPIIVMDADKRPLLILPRPMNVPVSQDYVTQFYTYMAYELLGIRKVLYLNVFQNVGKTTMGIMPWSETRNNFSIEQLQTFKTNVQRIVQLMGRGTAYPRYNCTTITCPYWDQCSI